MFFKTLICAVLIVFTSISAFCETLSEAREKLTEKNIEVTEQNFIAALQKEDINLIKLLLDAGINPDTTINRDGYTVLHFALGLKNPQIAQSLIARGANINAKASDGVTPIMVASQEGNDVMLKVLLDKGVNPNQTATNNGIDGFTPLMFAAANNNSSSIQLLTSRGAKINQKDSTGKTALRYAVISGSIEAAKALIEKGANVNETADKGVSLLHLSVYKRDAKMVRFLLQNGADINARIRGTGSTALDFAQGEGYDDIVAILKNASIGSKSKREQSNSAFVEIADLAREWEQYIGKTVTVTGYSGIHDDTAYVYEERCKRGLNVFLDIGNISKDTYKAFGRAKICQERKALLTILVHGLGTYKMSVMDAKILD